MLALLPRAALSLVLLAAIAGCGRDRDLGSGGGSSTGSTGAGGAASTGSTGTGSGTGTTSTTTGSTTGTGGSGGTGTMPSGPTKLTIVDGINDYPAIRLCFSPSDTPWPAAATGLAFAAGAVVSPIDATIPVDGDVTPWVIAGDLAQTAGKSCTEILALAAVDGSGVLARPLPLIPALVWTSNRSLLLVPNGCVGGPGHDDANGKNACGTGYTSTTPTATLALVSMSRVEDPSHVSIQVVGGSAAMPELDVKLVPNLTGASPQLVVPSLTPGAIGPTPPWAKLTVNELGALSGVQIQTFSSGTTIMSSTTLLSDVLAHGGAAESDVVNGARLVLVALGAAPGLPTGGFWNGLTYTLVKAEP